MKSDDIEQLKELVEFLKENEIAEFDLERGDLKVRLKFASAIVPPAVSSNVDLAALARLMSAGAGPVAASSGPGYGVGSGIGTLHSQADGGHGHRSDAGSTGGGAPDAQPEETLHIIKSPIVGTFYESPSPGTSAFVTNGDRIEKGQVVCIVEAMKLMNEIEADAAGEIVKRLVNNGQPIEYGQPLFAIRVN